MRHWLRRAIPAMMLLAAGCAVGPDFEPPRPPAAARLVADAPSPPLSITGDHPVLDPKLSLPAEWWTLLGNETVNRLVRDALANNSDLAAAEAALRIAEANTDVERAALFPGLGASFQAARQKTSAALSPVLADSQQTFNLYTPQVTVSYTLDLFGGTRRAVEASEAAARSQQNLLRATRLTLAANVALAAIQYASLSDQLGAQVQITQSASDLRDMFRDQVAKGASSSAALAAQEALLFQAQAALALLQKQLAQQHDLLAALSGRVPSEFEIADLGLKDLALPQRLPDVLPADLARRRPDVQAAEENLHAANAEVGVAVAAMLPNITLSAADGSAASATNALFGPGAGFWSLGAGVLQPLFQGGALLAKKRAADAALDQAKAQYRSAVTTAFQNTADALQALRYDADAFSAEAAAEGAARTALDRVKKQQELGDTGKAAVLLAEQAYAQARMAALQAQASRYADTVALFQAIGGGWEVSGRVSSTSQNSPSARNE